MSLVFLSNQIPLICLSAILKQCFFFLLSPPYMCLALCVDGLKWDPPVYRWWQLNYIVSSLWSMKQASHMALVVKNPPANAGDVRDVGLIPGSRRFPREGHGNPLQYSCLENHTDRRAWRATINCVAQSWTQLKRLCTHTA